MQRHDLGNANSSHQQDKQTNRQTHTRHFQTRGFGLDIVNRVEQKKEGVREGETKGKRKRAGEKGKDRCGRKSERGGARIHASLTSTTDHQTHTNTVAVTTHNTSFLPVFASCSCLKTQARHTQTHSFLFAAVSSHSTTESPCHKVGAKTHTCAP